MKKILLPIFLFSIMLVSVAGSVVLLNIGSVSEYSNATEPQASLALGVSVGDEFYYSVYALNDSDPQYLTEDSFSSQEIQLLRITSIGTDYLTRDDYSSSESNGWNLLFKSSTVENYTQTAVYNHTFIEAGLYDISIYNQELNDSFASDFNCSSPNVTAVTANGLHHVILSGYENDSPSLPVKIECYINQTTGVLISFAHSQGGVTRHFVLMGYNSPTIAPSYPSTFNYFPGDRLVIAVQNETLKSQLMDDGSVSAATPVSAGDDLLEWKVFDISFVYSDPITSRDYVIVNVSYYADSKLTVLKGEDLWRLEGCVDPLNDSTSIGSHFFKASLVMSDVESDIVNVFVNELSLSEYEYKSDDCSFSLDGNTTEGLKVNIYLEILPGYGFPKIFNQHIVNVSSGEVMGEAEVTIDGPGVIKADPLLGVAVGDHLRYLIQHESDVHEEIDGQSYDYHDAKLHYKDITITYIFGLEHGLIAVYGDVSNIDYNDPSIIYDFGEFVPLTIFNASSSYPIETDSPFKPLGDNTYFDGPPIIFAKGIDLGSDINALKSKILKDFDDPAMVPTSFYLYASDSVIGFSMKVDDGANFMDTRVILTLDAQSGITTYIRSEDEGNEEVAPGQFNHYSDRMTMVLYSVDGTVACSSVSASSTIDTNVGDSYIWVNSFYDEKEGKVDVKLIKTVVTDLPEVCDNSIVVLGERYFYDNTTDQWNPEYWSTGVPLTAQDSTPPNLWILGVATTMTAFKIIGSDFLGTVPDWSVLTDEIAVLLNVAVPLPPGVTITTTDISYNGSSLRVNKTLPDGSYLILAVAANSKGILQDRFFGIMYANGSWAQWDRGVLESAPAGETGESFDDIVPPGYSPLNPAPTNSSTEDTEDTTGDVESPFGQIAGYPLFTLSFFAVVTIVSVIKGKTSRR